MRDKLFLIAEKRDERQAHRDLAAVLDPQPQLARIGFFRDSKLQRADCARAIELDCRRAFRLND